MSEDETIRCNWCSKPRKPSAYAGDDHFPRLLDICQWCRAAETRKTRGEAPEWVRKWTNDTVLFLRESDKIEATLKGKPLRDSEEEAECEE